MEYAQHDLECTHHRAKQIPPVCGTPFLTLQVAVDATSGEVEMRLSVTYVHLATWNSIQSQRKDHPDVTRGIDHVD